MGRFFPVLLVGLFIGAAVSDAADSPFPLLQFAEGTEDGAKLEDLVSVKGEGEPGRRIWAISRKTSFGLFYLDARKWHRADTGNLQGDLYPGSLHAGSGGDVYVLWHRRGAEPLLVLLRHGGADHEKLFVVPDNIPNPVATPIRDGGIIVTGEKFSGRPVPKFPEGQIPRRACP